MKVLLVGVGGVGEAIAVVAQDRPWLESMVLADINIERAREVHGRLHAPEKFAVASVDASDRGQIVALAQAHGVDLILNAVEPLFNEAIFDAAFEAGCNYLDMAMTLSTPDPERPFERPGVKLGDYQFERAPQWERKGLLALVGMGVEPGMADVFARYAEKHLFDRIDEIGVRDGANLEVRGYEFAPNFSIWTTIEECLNPPLIWEKGRGWYTTEPFSEPEVFDFPEGIGPQECVNVEHATSCCGRASSRIEWRCPCVEGARVARQPGRRTVTDQLLSRRAVAASRARVGRRDVRQAGRASDEA